MKALNKILFLKDKKVPLILILMFFFYVLQVPLGLLRLYRFNSLSYIWITFSYLSFPLFTFIMALKFIDFRKFRFDAFSSLLMGMCFLGTIMGFVNGNSIVKILVDVGRIFFVLFFYIYFGQVDLSTDYVKKYFKYLSDAMIIVYGLAVVLTYGIAVPLGWVRYLSLGSEMMFVPIAFNFWNKDKKRLLVSIIIVILSVKRGVIISMILMILMMISSMKNGNFNKVILRTISMLLVVVFVLYIGLFITYPVIGSKLIFLKRWEALMPWSPKFSIRNASSGRFEEVSSAIQGLREKPLGMYIGGGNGFTYTFKYKTGAELFIKEGYRNVHISPISMVILYGIPLTLCFYFLIYKLFAISHGKIYHLFTGEEKKLAFTIYYIAMGMILYTFFAFELLQEPILWCCMGFISNMSRRSKQLSEESKCEQINQL